MSDLNSIVNPMKKFEFLINKAGIEHKSHQYDAVNWCIQNELRGNIIEGTKIRGGFLADEMGLGKTIVMIGLFFSNFVNHTLIVLPTPLIQQWANEMKRITGHKVLIYHGNNKKNITIEHIKNAPFVITTYNAIAENTASISIIHKMKWNRIVFDEAHHLRNQNSRSSGATLLKSNIRWLISGTPIQNKLKDLLNLCSVLRIRATLQNINEIIEYLCLRRTKKQIGIKIPDLKLNNISVQWKNDKIMGGKKSKTYKKNKRGGFTYKK